MKKAFTMIELIFVIVIIGILAVIAIPKLMATRDDAKTVVELNNLANCIKDIAGSYTSKQLEDNSSSACKSLKCSKVDLGTSHSDGNITVTIQNSSSSKDKYCDYVKKSAKKKNLEGNHSFGGSKIKTD